MQQLACSKTSAAAATLWLVNFKNHQLKSAISNAELLPRRLTYYSRTKLDP
jgi:hypothetical protein